VAWSWFRQSGVISSRPPAGNANRWAQEENPWNSREGKVESLQLARTPCATTCKMKCTPSYSGGAACASWRNSSFLACQPSTCGAIISVVYRVGSKNKVVQRAGSLQAPQMLFECTVREVLPALCQPAPNNACT